MQLHLRVIEAQDIAKMDAYKSDPYCVISLSSSNDTRRTGVIRNTLNPRWNEEFHFNVPNPSMSALKILMRDKDLVKDDDMANLDIQLCSLPVGQVVDQWYNMIPVRRVKKGGRIHLLLHLAPNGVPPFQPCAPQPVMPPPQPVMPPPQPMMPPPQPMMPPPRPMMPPPPPPGFIPVAPAMQPVIIPTAPPGVVLPQRLPGMTDKEYRKMCKKFLKYSGYRY